MSNHLTPYRDRVSLAELTAQQQRFVELYLEMGSRKGGAIDSALEAGYGSGTNRQAAKARASELLRNPNVLAALHGEIGKRLSASASVGVSVLVDLAQKAKSEQVRLGAARELVDRGYGPVMSRNTPPPDSKQHSIEQFLANLKIVDGNEVEAGGASVPTIDGETEE